jgi:hypothetical protein
MAELKYHRCRDNQKDEQKDDARLQQQIMIVVYGVVGEPAALCTAGSDYVR